MKKILFSHKCFVKVIFIFFMVTSESIFAQWFMEVDDSEIKAVWEMFQEVMPKRSGNFATQKECEDALNQHDWLPGQRAKYKCRCESNCDGQNSSNSDYGGEQYISSQNPERVVVDDYETQMMKRKLIIEKDSKQKAYEDKVKNENMKKDVMSKLKGNKSLDQLKTTSELSKQGSQNNYIEGGRVNTESAFTDGKFKLKRDSIVDENIPQVSPPTIIENQKKLFEYVERETKIVQTKIVEVQKEKIQILEKKNQIQEKIADQTLKIEKLKKEKIELKEESKKEEIDSLLLEAMQLLDESEQLNENAGKELENKDKLLGDQEMLLNQLQTSYDQGKDNPEKSEQLLNELQKGKK